MSVESAASYLVSTRFGDDSLAESRQQRTNHKYTASEFRTFLNKVRTLEIVEIEVVGTKRIVVSRQALHLHADVLKQQYKIIHIPDVWDIMNYNLIRSEQRSANHLKSLILGSLRSNLSL